MIVFCIYCILFNIAYSGYGNRNKCDILIILGKKMGQRIAEDAWSRKYFSCDSRKQNRLRKTETSRCRNGQRVSKLNACNVLTILDRHFIRRAIAILYYKARFVNEILSPNKLFFCV